MGQPITVHRVRAGADEYRVVRAAQRPGWLALRDEYHWVTLYADRAGLSRLLALWALAARSPRSLVHLPLRAAPFPSGAPSAPAFDGAPVLLDLVLAHHSLQFRPSAWKGLRSRLGPGRPGTTGTPAADFPASSPTAGRRHHRDHHDHLRFDRAARTLFVTGSAPAFRDHGRQLLDLLAEAPARHHRGQSSALIGHECAELAPEPRRFTTARPTVGTLHVQYCPDRSP